MRDKKAEPKKGASKIDAMRAERERRAEVQEKRTKCLHPKVDAKCGDIGTCLDCGEIVRCNRALS